MKIKQPQETIDFYIKRLRKSQISIVSGWLGQIRQLLDESEDIAEFYDRLPEIYPELDPYKFSKNFNQALVASSLAGVYEASLNELPVEFAEPDKAEYQTVPFTEAISFFNTKGNLDTDKWDDLQDSQHDSYFVSASAKGALLQDLRQEVEKAIIDGQDREQFKAAFNDIVKRRGWDVKGGNDWRAGIIYQTNLRQAYGDGRCRQMSDPDVVAMRPYRMWLHGNSAEPRETHIAMNGRVFRSDDSIANQRLPMGYGCFLAGTKVATPKGWEDIEKLAIGDLIIGGSGNIKPILSTSARQYKGEVIGVGTDNGECFATPNHRFLTLRGWVKAENLDISDVLVNVIPDHLAPVVKNSANQTVVNVDKVQTFVSNVQVSLPVNLSLSIAFNTDRDAVNPNVNPIGWNRQIEPSIKATRPQKLNHQRFSFGRLGSGVSMAHRFFSKSFFGSSFAFCYNVGVKERRSSFELFGDFSSAFVSVFGFAKSRVVDTFLGLSNGSQSFAADFTPIRVSNVLQSYSFALRDIQPVVMKQSDNSSIVHAEMLAKLPNGKSLLDIEEPEGFVSGYPLDLFNSLEDFRLWAVGHGKLSKIVHLHPIVHSGNVYNLTVLDDESYCLKVGVVHNCRCTWVTLSERDLKRRGLQVTSGLNWNDIIPTAKGDQPLEIDKGFKNPCKFETDKERDDRRRNQRKAVYDRLPEDNKKAALFGIALALGGIALVVAAMARTGATTSTVLTALVAEKFKVDPDSIEVEVLGGEVIARRKPTVIKPETRTVDVNAVVVTEPIKPTTQKPLPELAVEEILGDVSLPNKWLDLDELEDLNEKFKSIVLAPPEDIVATKDYKKPLDLPSPEPPRPVAKVVREVVVPTKEQIEYLRRSAKSKLPFSVNINVNPKYPKSVAGTVNVQPGKRFNYQWTADQAKTVREWLESEGYYVKKYPAGDAAYVEGFNFLKRFNEV